MSSRFTPAAISAASQDRDDEEATFERLRHVRFDEKRSPKKRRILERAQQQNAKTRRSA